MKYYVCDDSHVCDLDISNLIYYCRANKKPQSLVLRIIFKNLFVFTASRFKSPRNLKTSDSTMSSFRVTWEPAPGEVKGYKVTFHPTGDDRRLGELVVGPYDNTVVLEELR